MNLTSLGENCSERTIKMRVGVKQYICESEGYLMRKIFKRTVVTYINGREEEFSLQKMLECSLFLCNDIYMSLARIMMAILTPHIDRKEGMKMATGFL